MGKYNASFRLLSQKPRLWEVHPVWRGIGCLLIILLPVLALASAKLLVQEIVHQRWVAIPRFMWYGFQLPPFGQVYLVDLATSILILIVLFGLLTVVYSFFFRIFSPR